MKNNLDRLVMDWLTEMEVPVAKKFIHQQLINHPHYPTLLSVTDLLDELGIENASVIVDKNQLHELPTPFVAHTSVNGGEFLLVKNSNSLAKHHATFLKDWDGIIVIAEKSETVHHADNSSLLLEERKSSIKILTVLFIMIGFAGLALFMQPTLQYALLLITTITGLAIAAMIVQHELGIANTLTEQLCGISKHTDCNAVLQSKGSIIFSWLNWADIGIIWFCYVLLCLLIAPLTANVSGMVSLVAIVIIPSLFFTLFSIYYQWQVVKKWCTLCLLTIAVLWLQFGLLAPALKSLHISLLNKNIVLLSTLLFVVISMAWLTLIKPLLFATKTLIDNNTVLTSFKNNPEVFNALLQQQTKMPELIFDNELQLGNAHAAIQVMVACNAFCGPCAKLHKLMHEMAEKNNIGFTVRFAIRANDMDDIRTMAVTHILQHLTENQADTAYKRIVLHDWFEMMDFEKFTKKYMVSTKPNISVLLQQHELWAQQANIMFTPTVFINGYQLPKQYQISELKAVLKWCEAIQPKEETVVGMRLHNIKITAIGINFLFAQTSLPK